MKEKNNEETEEGNENGKNFLSSIFFPQVLRHELTSHMCGTHFHLSFEIMHNAELRPTQDKTVHLKGATTSPMLCAHRRWHNFQGFLSAYIGGTMAHETEPK